MRIRKRQVPLPLSCISPVPLSSLSDPNFNRSPVVQLPQQKQPPPPDLPIGEKPPTQGRDSSHGHHELKNKDDYLVLKQAGGGEERGGDQGEPKSNYSRKKSSNVLGVSLSSSQSGSSHQALGSWGTECERAFPLKKRRGSLEIGGNVNDDTLFLEKDDHKKTNKMNKKFLKHQNDNEAISSSSTVDHSNCGGGGAKKRGRAGGALMEGSRCSRVNGRGWRCCQQTLVGYSLCEHHLGKGRLRSMNSVRSRSLKKKDQKPINNNADPEYHDQQPAVLNSPQPQQAAKKETNYKPSDDHLLDDEDIDDRMSKKRVKLGMVKARSISSLLGQNVNVIAPVADDNN